MAGETDLNDKTIYEEPVVVPEPPPEFHPRPIDPAVLALLEYGRKIQEHVSEIRSDLKTVIDGLLVRFPSYKRQIAEVLEGEYQRLMAEQHQEQMEARRKSGRGV